MTDAMTDPSTGVAIVDAINDNYGVHAGRRAVHAKGINAEATFRAAPEVGALTSAGHLHGAACKAFVRFSNGSGDPAAPDAARDGRGIAVKIMLADGTSTDLVGITLPAFFVRTVDDFLAFTKARRPDPATGQPDLDAVLAFVSAHPETVPAVTATMGLQPPASFCRLTYNGLHAFALVDAAGQHTWFRWQLAPTEGEAFLDQADADARSSDYLHDELRDRLRQGSQRFVLRFQLAGPDDPLDDPTAVWPDERHWIDAGNLDVESVVADQVSAEGRIFDPTRVVDGVACSDDPILHARSAAYSVSYARRSS